MNATIGSDSGYTLALGDNSVAAARQLLHSSAVAAFASIFRIVWSIFQN